MGLLDTFRVKKFIEVVLTAPDPTAPDVLQAIKRLKQLGPSVLPKLIEALAHTPPPEPIVQLLGSLLHANTLPVFCTGLGHANSKVVAGLVSILSRSSAYDPNRLLEYLADPKIPKTALIQVLTAQKHALQAHAILALVQTMDKDNRGLIFRLLEQVATEAMVPGLLPLTQSEEWLVRQQVARILSRFPGTTVQEALLRLMQDPQKSVRLTALEGLASLPTAMDIGPLCRLLADPDLTVQSKAIEALIHINDPQAIPHLLDVLQDESEYVRRAAVEVLNAVGNTDAIKDLLNVLRDKDWWVRVRAADALGSIGGPKVVEAVLTLINDRDEFIRRCAIEILNTTKDPRAFDALVLALADPDWWVRERAVDALAQLGDPRAIPALIRLLAEDSDAIPAAIRALATFGDPCAVSPLLAKLHSSNTTIQKEAIRALASLTDAAQAACVQQALAQAMAAAPSDVQEPCAAVYRALVAKFGQRAQDVSEADVPSLLACQTSLLQSGALHRVGQALTVGAVQTSSVLSTSSAGTEGQKLIDAGELQPGMVLAERYRVIRQVGKGGFGTVVLVEDLVVHEEIVLKFLNPPLAANEQVIKRFIHELRYARKITHENVIRIYDFITLGSSVAISMEYFHSHTLASDLKRGVPIAHERGLKIIQDVCCGMSVAHHANIVHRDLKPQNILLDDQDLVKIVDFGLAAAMSHTESRLTVSGVLMGTPLYMAPEQVQGGEIDARTDIYSLGVIMYEMFTGRPPYLGKDPITILYQHVQGNATRPRDLNQAIAPGLERVIQTAMAVDPARRFQNVDMLRQQIAALISPEGA